MLNILFKSAVLYSFFQKYGKKIIPISMIIGVIILSHYLYSDIVDYLVLNEMKDKLIYALLIKWIFITVGIISIFYLLKTSNAKTHIDPPSKKENSRSNTATEQTSPLEQDIMTKDHLQSEGDKLIEALKKNKNT